MSFPTNRALAGFAVDSQEQVEVEVGELKSGQETRDDKVEMLVALSCSQAIGDGMVFHMSGGIV